MSILVPYHIGGKDFTGTAVDSKSSWQRRVYHHEKDGTCCVVYVKDRKIVNPSNVPDNILKYLKKG
jgi:hypothetical protein